VTVRERDIDIEHLFIYVMTRNRRKTLNNYSKDKIFI